MCKEALQFSHIATTADLSMKSKVLCENNSYISTRQTENRKLMKSCCSVGGGQLSNIYKIEVELCNVNILIAHIGRFHSLPSVSERNCIQTSNPIWLLA